MSKKKPISEREKARRKAAAEAAARANHAEPEPDKHGGRDLHNPNGAVRIIRHQGR